MIRKAAIEDVGQLLNITKLCAKHMISKGIYQWNEYYPNRSAFEIDILREELYVYVIDNKVIGCIVISEFMDEEYHDVTWLTDDSKQIYIHRLAVHPSFQGQGIARKMMDYAENFAKNNKYISVRLDTFSQNFRNQKFYEHRGYTKLGNIYFPKQSEHPFYCYELVF